MKVRTRFYFDAYINDRKNGTFLEWWDLMEAIVDPDETGYLQATVDGDQQFVEAYWDGTHFTQEGL